MILDAYGQPVHPTLDAAEERFRFVNHFVNVINDMEYKTLIRKGINRLSRVRGNNPRGTAETMSQYLLRYIREAK